MIKEALKAYGPYYVITGLMGRTKSIGVTLSETLMVLLRTVSFYALSSLLYSILRCAGTNNFGVSRAVVFLSGVVAWGVGSSIEDPNRRMGICLWQAQNFLQTLGAMMLARGILPVVPRGITYAFSLAVGIIYHFFINDHESCDPTAASLAKTFIGRDREHRSTTETKLFSSLAPGKGAFSPIDIFTGMASNLVLGFSIIQILALFRTLSGGPSAIVAGIKASAGPAFELGSFLSLLNTARAFSILSRQVTGSKRKLFPGQEFIFGCVAGLSMVRWTSTPVAMWILALAINSVVRKCEPLFWGAYSSATNTKEESSRTKMHRLASILIYGLTTATTLYALQFENHCVREGAQGFVSAMAGGQPVEHYEKLSVVLGKALGLPVLPQGLVL